MIECATKLKEGTPDQVAHHGLIKLLVEDALHTYKVPLSWETFRNLTKDGDIKMLTEELGSSSSEEKESVPAGNKEKGQKTTTMEQKKEQKKKQEKKGTKEKDDTPMLTAREKRLQSKVDKAEQVHVSKGTSTTATTKSKSKTHSAKQTKAVPPVSTGTPKPASTGSQKSTEKGSSTGSPEKAKPKEKKADILAREAAAVLAALSTPPKPKEKRKRETPLYFKARRSVRIKTGKPQPPSSNPITIEDAPTSPKERSPSKISVTYERGSPKKTTWKDRLDQLASKARLQDVEDALQETLARLKETERMEGEAPSSPPREGEVEPPK